METVETNPELMLHPGDECIYCETDGARVRVKVLEASLGQMSLHVRLQALEIFSQTRGIEITLGEEIRNWKVVNRDVACDKNPPEGWWLEQAD